MTPEQFVYWLQGFFEIQESTTLSRKQVQIINDHLQLVFNKVTPNYPMPLSPTIPSPTPNTPVYPWWLYGPTCGQTDIEFLGRTTDLACSTIYCASGDNNENNSD